MASNLVISCKAHSGRISTKPAFTYQVAGVPLKTDLSFAHLQAFELGFGHAFNLGRNCLATPVDDEAQAAVQRCAEGSLGGQMRPITVIQSGSTFQVNIDGIGCLTADTLSGEIWPISLHEEVDSGLLEEALLGTPLLLLLATYQRWLLHCSSVRHDGWTVAFVGRSGHGKSTLARYLDDQAHWKRVSDDMLPISWNSNRIDAWPHFPQFKLPEDEQPGSRHPQRLTLDAIYIIDAPDSMTDRVEIVSMPTPAAVAAVIGQTAGAKLFPPSMLSCHLEFCSQVIHAIPVRRLRYPRTFESLPILADALADDLSNL